MNDDLTGPAQKLVRRAKWQLAYETYAPILAPGVLALSLFVIGASLGLWQRIGDPWRGIALITTLFFLAQSLIKAQRLKPPTLSDAKRRVEQDSGLLHRPLDTIVDQPVENSGPNAQGTSTWKNHVHQAKSKVKNASAPKRRSVIGPRDKYYLRYITPIALVLTVMLGAGDNYERLRAGLLPVWQSGIKASDAQFEAWIDPPEYTSRPPSYFKNTKTLSAPEGSNFVVRITGVKSTPRLLIRSGERTKRVTPKRLGPKSFEAQATLNISSVASLRIGNMVKTWELNIGPDTPPLVDFVDDPKPGKRDKLIFTYNLKDDFGVEKLILSMQFEDEKPEEIGVPLPGSSIRKADKEQASLDLSKHKWAGKIVQGRLLAVDGKRQVGSSQMVEFLVPDKIFIEPLAKAVAENRILVMEGQAPYQPIKQNPKLDENAKRALFKVDRPDLAIERAPAPIQRVALLLEVITDRPSNVFDDPAVYMGLRSIYRRVNLARSLDELAGLDDELWEIALRAEFGLLGDALQEMRAAEQALNDAMARRAPQREIDVLFDRYNTAVDRYMDELMKKAVEDAKNNPKNGDGEDSGERNIQAAEIQKLLDAIEEANRMGDTATARKALAQLAVLLENMQINLSQGGNGGDGPGDPSMSDELKEALEELNELLGEQRELRDETQEKNRAEADRENGEAPGKDSPSSGSDSAENSKQGQQPGDMPSAQELAEQQGALRELLERLENEAKAGGADQNDGSSGTIEDENGDNKGGGTAGEDGQSFADALKNQEVQDALDRAKSAMGDSEELLGDGDFYAAGREQSEAIDALRKAGEQLFAEDAKRIQEERDRQGQNDDTRTDPFGRENGAGGIGDNVEVPEIDDRQRAYELLEELRKRSSEQDRDKTERDYLDRLLERF